MIFKYMVIALLLTAMSVNVYADAEGKGFVSGRALLASGKPMQNAVALFYIRQQGPAPLPDRYWRVPEAIVPIDSDGTFTAELQEGDYYVGAIGRESSKLAPGPPVEGDSIVLVRGKDGKPLIVTVKEGATVDLGAQKGHVYRKPRRDLKNKITTVEGIITLEDGTPVPNAFVFAFNSPDRGSKPVFASEKTDKSGIYVLKVDGDGTFFLKARDAYGGGKPQNGQLMGTFGGDDPTPVILTAGKRIKGIDIKVKSIQRPDGN
ncbi:MAG: hypothetical protein WCI45_05135 [Desulfuromonadales bacterium]